MKVFSISMAFLILVIFLMPEPIIANKKLLVVATISTYGDIAKKIGGDKVEVSSIVKGYQDPHFVTPKPSMALMLSRADLFISTGLDLELWAPSLVDKSKNPRIRSGEIGYVSASNGIKLLDKPTTMSRGEGDLHIYGNPHIYMSPLNGLVMADNIYIGLKKIDPANEAYYRRNLQQFKEKVYDKLFGKELVALLGAEVLVKLAESDRLIEFLQKKKFQGKPLIDSLGGWLKKALPLRGLKLIGYHKNWTYFAALFGLNFVDFIEPKPGIPPSAKHVANVVSRMRNEQIQVIASANYFDESKIKDIGRKVNAITVIGGMTVDGEPGMDDFFKVFDIWIGRLIQAFNTK